jgi:hypothetical protein
MEDVWSAACNEWRGKVNWEPKRKARTPGDFHKTSSGGESGKPDGNELNNRNVKSDNLESVMLSRDLVLKKEINWEGSNSGDRQ